MLTRIMTSLCILFLLASCGSKKETIPVKLKIIQGSQALASSFVAGGLLVMGKSEDGKQSFRLGLTNADNALSIDLVKGRWEFAAVSWSGANGPLTGDNRCAYSGMMDLKDSEASVTFNLSMTRCLTDFNGRQFSQQDFILPTGKFLDFSPVMCMKAILNNEYCSYQDNPSNILSYKIIYEGDAKGDVKTALTSLISNCLQMNTAPRTKLPVTDQGTDSPFSVKLLFYTSTDCSGSALSYKFDDGLRSGAQGATTNVLPLGATYSNLFINPGALYDMTPAMAVPFLFNNMVLSGSYYSNSLNVDIAFAGAIPPNVVSMCMTTNSSCTASEWKPISNVLTYMLYAGTPDGVVMLNLFYKTFNGVVSPAPSTSGFTLDRTPPSAPLLTAPIFSTNTGATFTWTGGTDVNFDHAAVFVCSDVNCTTIIATQGISDPNAKTYTLPPVTIPGMTAGASLCAMVKIYDKVGNYTLSNSLCSTVSGI